MKLTSTRSLESLRPVLKNQRAVSNIDPVYWVFSDVDAKEKWKNTTIIAPGKIDGEYTKTFGHYHGLAVNETYKLIFGEGLLLLQKKHFEEDIWIPEAIDEFLIIKAKVGDEITITPEYGHAWINTSDLPLISLDDWKEGHRESDYADIKRLNGLAYYIVEEDGDIKAVPNPNYRNLPEPKWS